MQCNFLQEQGKIQIPFEWSYEKKWLKVLGISTFVPHTRDGLCNAHFNLSNIITESYPWTIKTNKPLAWQWKNLIVWGNSVSGRKGHYRNVCKKYFAGERCIRICTDSQASIKALENPSTTSALVREAKNTLNEMARTSKVIIAWIPGLSGYKGNETAGTLAKQGAESSEQPDRKVGAPYQEGCNALRRRLGKGRSRIWTNSQGCRWSKTLLGE